MGWPSFDRKSGSMIENGGSVPLRASLKKSSMRAAVTASLPEKALAGKASAYQGMGPAK